MDNTREVDPEQISESVEAREKEQARINKMTKREYRQYKSQWRKAHQIKVGLIYLPVNKQPKIKIQDTAPEIKPGDPVYEYLYFPNGKRKPYWMVRLSIRELEKKAAQEKREKRLINE